MSWNYFSFSEVVKDITGGNVKFQSNEYNSSGRFPIIDQGASEIAGYTDKEEVVKRKKDVILFGDHTKCLKYVDFDFCLGADGVKVLQPIDGLDTKFLYFYLSTIILPDVGYSRHFKFLKETKIPLPPLATQQHIAAILDAADALRRKDQELLQKYDALAQAIFIDMFGDPVKNEKGWEVKKIEEFGKVQTGNTPSRAIKEYYGDFIEWIKTDNIILDKIYLTKATECLSKKGLAKGRSAESGSILVTCIAGSAKTIGNVALADRKVTFNQQINSLTPNSNYNSIFIYSLFRSCKPIIQGNTTQGMKRIITKSVFEKLELISPPKHLQDEYEQKYLIFLRNKEILNYQVNISENLFQTLLQKSFKAASE